MEERAKGTVRRVLNAAWRLLERIVAGYVTLQLISTLPLAYLLGLLQTFVSGTPMAFDSIPPWTFPILSFLVLVVVSKPAFLDPYLQNRERKLREKKELAVQEARKEREVKARRKEKLRQYAKSIDLTALDLEQLDHLSYRIANELKLRQRVQQRVDKLLPVLKHFRGSLETPGPIKVDDSLSRQQWLACLRDERIRTAESLSLGRELQEIDGFIEIPTFTEADDIPF